MEQFLAQLKAALRKHGYALVTGGAAVVAIAASLWVGIPARRQAAALSAEAARVQAVINSSQSWVTQFQPASNEESALWQNTQFQIQALGVPPSERLTLAQLVARRADNAGFGSAHLKLKTLDGSTPPPARQVAGITFNPAGYKIEVTGTGGFGPLSAFVAMLPPAVDLQSIRLTRDSDRVNTSLSLSVFEPAGANGK